MFSCAPVANVILLSSASPIRGEQKNTDKKGSTQWLVRDVRSNSRSMMAFCDWEPQGKCKITREEDHSGFLVGTYGDCFAYLT